jgi:hypothetical protein
MPKMFMRVKDSKTKKVYYFQWSTISDDVNSDVTDADGFVELHYKLTGHNYPNRNIWAEVFALNMIQLSKFNVSTLAYTRAELLACSDEHKTVKSLVEYCKTNFVKM